jgi:hypothetical protein
MVVNWAAFDEDEERLGTGGGDGRCVGGASRLDLRSFTSWLRIRESLRVVVDDMGLALLVGWLYLRYYNSLIRTRNLPLQSSLFLRHKILYHPNEATPLGK